MQPIIEFPELITLQTNPNLLLIDVSNHKDAYTNFLEEHLKGAIFVDVSTDLTNSNLDPSIGGRHPLPTVSDFLTTLFRLGIDFHKHIVIYDDRNGTNAAARLWWMLKAIGHEQVQVLNGGLQYAKRNNYPTESGISIALKTTFTYTTKQWLLPTIGIEEVDACRKNTDTIIIDVRDSDRYAGITEPLDLIAGHIPGAINIPFHLNCDDTGKMKAAEELRTLYTPYLTQRESEQIVVHCGSGVTACHTLLALAYAGFSLPKLYVGSWSEWSRSGKPIEVEG